MNYFHDDHSEWKQVGTVGVDSGQIAVGDPCYTQSAEADWSAPTWDDWLAKTYPDTFGPEPKEGDMPKVAEVMGAQGIGIVVASGYGDGEYPVFVKTNREGRIMAVMVDFDPDEEDEDDEED